MTSPTNKLREAALKIRDLLIAEYVVPLHLMPEIESILRETVEEATLGATTMSHKDIYWQAGEISRLKDKVQKARSEAFEECARIADKWAMSASCGRHDDDPCCHVRTGDGIASAIRRALKP